MILYNMSYLLDACQIGQVQKKKSSSSPESSFEPHPKVSQLATEICDFFLDVHEDLDLFNLITGNLMQYIIH